MIKFEKPVDADDARRMLEMLSGRWHKVLTSASWIEKHGNQSCLPGTEVKFAVMSNDELDCTLPAANRWTRPAAGSRARARFMGNQEIFNVVGLPVRLLYELFAGSCPRDFTKFYPNAPPVAWPDPPMDPSLPGSRQFDLVC